MHEIDRILIAKSKKNKKNILSILWSSLKNKFLKKNKHNVPKFSGWGMDISHSLPPWIVKPKKNDELFLQINKTLLDLIDKKKFNLSQFNYFDANYEKILDELKWRHYILFNCCLNLIKDNNNNKINIVECGVCDGLTFYFISKCFELNKIDFEGYLYDSWSKFNFDNKKDLFDYSYLNIDVTKNNLLEFKDKLNFNEGNIPEVFKTAQNPDKVDLLHIDLNSDKATKDTLLFFYERISTNGIIIFDDYGRIDMEKEVIDDFFSNKKGKFFSMPTGQGIFIKS